LILVLALILTKENKKSRPEGGLKWLNGSGSFSLVVIVLDELQKTFLHVRVIRDIVQVSPILSKPKRRTNQNGVIHSRGNANHETVAGDFQLIVGAVLNANSHGKTLAELARESTFIS
jgi:hypothetical protein